MTTFKHFSDSTDTFQTLFSWHRQLSKSNFRVLVNSYLRARSVPRSTIRIMTVDSGNGRPAVTLNKNGAAQKINKVQPLHFWKGGSCASDTEKALLVTDFGYVRRERVSNQLEAVSYAVAIVNPVGAVRAVGNVRNWLLQIIEDDAALFNTCERGIMNVIHKSWFQTPAKRFQSLPLTMEAFYT